MEPRSDGRSAGPRWGEPGSPIVPESLRAALGGRPLPAWTAEAIGHPEGATVADRDSGVWRTLTSFDARLVGYLRALVADPRLANTKVWDRPWPLGLLPSMLPLTVRVANVLARRDLADDVETLSVMTYGELLSVPGMGLATVLELACAADSVLAVMDEDPVARSADVLRALQGYTFVPWTAQVGSRDPRFRALLPSGEGTLRARMLSLKERRNDYAEARALLAAIPAVERKCRAIAAMALEDAVDDLIAAATDFPAGVRAAVIARLGWGGERPVTCEAAAASADLHPSSMERRVRIAQARFFRRDTLYLPALDRALDVLSASAPLLADEAAALLAAKGVSRQPFGAESLRRLAEAFGRTVPAALLGLSPPPRPRGRSSPTRRRKKSRFLRLVLPVSDKRR